MKTKITRLGLGVLAFALVSSQLAFAKTVAVSGSARVVYASGIVNVRKSQLVSAGYRLKTGRTGRIALAFANGHRLRVGANSDVQLVSYRPQRKQTLVRVNRGRVYNKVSKGNRVIVRGRHSTAAVLGTAYDLEVDDKQTQTTVFNGSVGVQRSESTDKQTSDQIFDSAPVPGTAQPASTSAAFQAPTEVAAPMKVIPGPQEVSLDQWLEIIANQQISINAEGQAMVHEINAQELFQQVEWFRWNKQMDNEFKGE